LLINLKREKKIFLEIFLKKNKMKYKIIFGIAIPLFLIITLAIIASYGSIESEEDFIESISLNDISKDGQIKPSIKVGDIKLTNDYNLPKRYELPSLGVCLIDSEGFKQKLEAGSIEYSEGDYSYGQEIYARKVENYRSVEVGSKEDKTVSVYLIPSYVFSKRTNKELIEEYKDYNELIIYKKEKQRNSYNRYNYLSCNNLNQKQVDEAIHMAILS